MATAAQSFDVALAPFGEKQAKTTGFFGRFVQALMESRRIAAEREIARHERFIAEVNAFNKGGQVKTDDLPF